MINVTTYVTDTVEDFAAIIVTGEFSHSLQWIFANGASLNIQGISDFINLAITPDAAQAVARPIGTGFFGRVAETVSDLITGTGAGVLTQRWS